MKKIDPNTARTIDGPVGAVCPCCDDEPAAEMVAVMAGDTVLVFHAECWKAREAARKSEAA